MLAGVIKRKIRRCIVESDTSVRRPQIGHEDAMLDWRNM